VPLWQPSTYCEGSNVGSESIVNLAFRLNSGEPNAVGPKLPGSLQVNRKLNQWLAFERDGEDCWIVIKPGKVEIGQGIHTALVQIAAHELFVDPDQIRVQTVATGASPDEAVTSGSLSIQECGTAIRHASAQAHYLLLNAIAIRENRDAPLMVQRGVVFERGSAPIGTYWDLGEAQIRSLLDVEASSSSALNKEPPRWVSHSLPRLDLPEKLRGTPNFIHDLRLPRMQFAISLRSPFQTEVLKKLVLDKEVNLVDDGQFAAAVSSRLSALQRVQSKFEALEQHSRDASTPTQFDTRDWLLSAAVSKTVVAQEGDVNARSPSTNSFTATFFKPWLAHASIGLSCAIATYVPGKEIRVLTHSQGIYNLRQDLFVAFGEKLSLSLEHFIVEHVMGSGCYGHNGADDVAFDAVRVAITLPSTPVRLQWSRTQEMSCSPFSPAMLVRVTANLDEGAAPTIAHWKQEIWSNGHSSRPGRAATPTLLGAVEVSGGTAPRVSVNPPLAAGGGADRNSVPGYAITNLLVENNLHNTMPIRSSAFRGLGAIANVFAIESMMDEMAASIAEDPLAFRLRHLQSDPRAIAVVTRAASMSGWAADNLSLGIAYACYKNTGAWCCVVAQVELTERVNVRKLWIVADVGLAINPDGVLNQLEGGAIQATSIAIKEEAGFAANMGVAPNWENYPILKFSEVPQVEVELIHSNDTSLGAGEAATAPVIAAIHNAVARSLGEPSVYIRRLPLTPATIAAAV
jgi:CO/xanthine dehydrogenase Mo-binding subunit